MNRRISRKHRRGQSGSALAAVLCLIFSGSILLTMILAVSKTTAFTVIPHTRMQKSFYINEGIANRMQYLIAADRSLNSDENFDTVDFSEFDYERFLPDGSEHIINYHGTRVSVIIQDMQGGLNLAGNNYASTLTMLAQYNSDDTEYTDKLDDLRNQMQDYTDNDDSVTEEGLEADDFELAGQLPLPRNSAMEFREELLYLPMFRELFPPDRNGILSAIRLIPPETDSADTVNNQNRQNQQNQQNRQNQQMAQTNRSNSNYPSIFNAPDIWFTGAIGLEDNEVEEVKTAITRFRTEKIKLSDILENDLLEKLRNGTLNWQPGDYYTLTIQPAPDEKQPGQRLRCSFRNNGVEGPSDYFVRYLEWLVY